MTSNGKQGTNVATSVNTKSEGNLHDEPSSQQEEDEATGGPPVEVNAAVLDVLMDDEAVVPDVLCSTCKSLFDGSRTWHENPKWGATRVEWAPYTAHCEEFQTLGKVYRSAAKGCHFCATIHSRIHHLKENDRYVEEIENRCPFASGLHGMNLEDFDEKDDQIHLLLFCGWFDNYMSKGTTVAMVFEPRLYASTNNGKKLLLLASFSLWPTDQRRARNLYDNKSGLQSVFNMNWMANKLSQCAANHEMCGTNRIHTGIPHGHHGPKRLLDISTIGTSELVKLVDYGGLANSPMYTAVSHRWGDSSQLLLTSETRSMLYSDLPLSQLPRLFQDISKVAHKLGYNYLWIDTLCIQQDDSEDWQLHADRMSSIYAMSSLNIIASGALHHQPLFWPRRNMLVLTDMYITPTWTQFDQKLLMHHGAPLDSDPLEHEPIASRGWVFQERLLAPRTLHFVKEQIVWECRHSLVRNLEKWGNWPTPEKRSQPKQDLMALFKSDEPHPDLILRFWMNQVAMYSRTVTTFEEDWFFALSGAANILQGLFTASLGASINSNYYAGMWRYKIEHQLSWHIVGALDEAQTARPKSYRAPKWSWGSVNGSIRFAPDSGYKPVIDLNTWASGYVDTNVRSLVQVPDHAMKVLFGVSPFGPVQEGSTLLLWCNMCRVSLTHKGTFSGGSGHDSVLLSLFRIDSSGKRGATLWKSEDNDSRTSVRWDDRVTIKNNEDATNEDLFFVPLVFTAGERRRNGSGGCSYLWDVSEVKPETTKDRNAEHAIHHPQYFPSAFRFEQFREEAKAEERLGAPLGEIGFRFCIYALMLKPVKDSPRRYTRIGLAVVIINWAAQHAPSVETARGFFSAFRRTENLEQGLPKPIAGDPSVFEIELI